MALANLAVLVDKYDCRKSFGSTLKLIAHQRLKAGLTEPYALLEILIVSFVLDDSSTFMEVSTSLVMSHDIYDSSLDYLTVPSLRLLPTLTIGKLESSIQSKRITEYLLALLDEQNNRLHHKFSNNLRQISKCEASDDFYDPKCWEELEQSVGWPYKEGSASLSQLLLEHDTGELSLELFVRSVRSDLECWKHEQMADMVDLELKPNQACHAFTGRVREIVEEFEKQKKGLCLYCVRTEQRDAGSCTLKH